MIGIIRELDGRLAEKTAGRAKDDRRLAELPGTLTLVDATLITAMPRIMQSVRQENGKVRAVLVEVAAAHTLLEVDRHVPSRIDVTPNGGGDNDEQAVMERTIESDRLLCERPRLREVHAVQRHCCEGFELRVPHSRQQHVHVVIEEKPLTDADRTAIANVLSDQIVSLGSPTNMESRRPAKPHDDRVIIVKIKPHVSKGKYAGGSSGVDSDGFLRIVTSLLDVPAEIIRGFYMLTDGQSKSSSRQFEHLLWDAAIC